jgi:hypothetical protein
VVDRITTKMIQSTRQSSHQTSEIVAYHKVKRKFLSLTDIEKEDPDKHQICEFRGQKTVHKLRKCYLYSNRYKKDTTKMLTT